MNILRVRQAAAPKEKIGSLSNYPGDLLRVPLCLSPRVSHPHASCVRSRSFTRAHTRKLLFLLFLPREISLLRLSLVLLFIFDEIFVTILYQIFVMWILWPQTSLATHLAALYNDSRSFLSSQKNTCGYLSIQLSHMRIRDYQE